MKGLFQVLTVLALVLCPAAASTYFPARGEWKSAKPEDVGMNVARLEAAIAFAVANENKHGRDVAAELRATFGKREPLFRLLGPTQPRAGVTGLVIRNGYLVASWGDPDRTDMTHSITKTFLSTVVGLAVHDRLIGLQDPVHRSQPTSAHFESDHNRAITWDHLLRQTSEWDGTLWDIPDWADRPTGPEDQHAKRKLHAPGTVFEYNDVRVNLLSLCALNVFREPLPSVLRRRVMDPIGASNTWRWYGYENSWVTIDGTTLQSVSGGGHFGGGMFISAWDLARFGYLFLRDGTWEEKPIVPRNWIELARTPGTANAEYGFMNWYLNLDRRALPAAPASAVTFRGNGVNIVYIDQTNDLVVVVRWIDNSALPEFIAKILAAFEQRRN
jgi:CubicO group peptidase (beta-lactamase class C family)